MFSLAGSQWPSSCQNPVLHGESLKYLHFFIAEKVSLGFVSRIPDPWTIGTGLLTDLLMKAKYHKSQTNNSYYKIKKKDYAIKIGDCAIVDQNRESDPSGRHTNLRKKGRSEKQESSKRKIRCTQEA